MTVSNVVNNKLTKVSKDTAAKIQAAINEMGYIPNSSKKNVTKDSSKIIALILRGENEENVLENPHNALLVGTIIKKIQQRGYFAVLNIMDSESKIAQNLQTCKAEGAIFLGMFDNEIETIYNVSKIPMVFTDSYSTLRQLSNVGINDYKGGQLAAKHFLNLGHKRLAFVGPPVRSNGVVQHRFLGFSDELCSHGIILGKENCFTIESATEQTAILSLGKEIASCRNDITGIFVTSDQIAAFLIQGLIKAGARVPEDFSIIGFDDLVVCRQMTPKLTTISQDFRQKGKLAADILFRQLLDPLSPSESLILDVELIERESVCKVTSVPPL